MLPVQREMLTQQMLRGIEPYLGTLTHTQKSLFCRQSYHDRSKTVGYMACARFKNREATDKEKYSEEKQNNNQPGDRCSFQVNVDLFVTKLL